jgi:hypothetical protein
MKQQIPFHDLICTSCRSAAAGERVPELDYAITEVVVKNRAGIEVTVPIEIKVFDVIYEGAGRSSARVLARVPCPSCQSTHQIDITAVREAPAVELEQTTCPKCKAAVCVVSKGPSIFYRSETPGEAWVEVAAELTCPSCGNETKQTGNLRPDIFDAGDNVVFVQFRKPPEE